MEPQKFLELAQLLAFGTPQPERLRCATSRAYYAVYNVSLQILLQMGFRIGEGPGGHGEVRNFLGASNNLDLQKVSSQLATLHSNRIMADYRLNNPMAENQQNVKAHVEQAKRMIQTLERCCLGQERNEIIEGIKEWKRLTNQ